MKIFPIIIGLVFMGFAPLSSQIGLMLGVHSFELNNPKSIIFPNQSTIDYKESKLGFQAGIYGRVKIGGLFVEPRMMLHSDKVEYRLDGENGDLPDQLRSESFTNLDIPLLIGTEILFLEVITGPVIHMHVDSVSDLMDFDGYSAKFSNAKYGWRTGVGTTLGNFKIGLEYEGNFSNFGDHINIGDTKFSFSDKPSRLILNIGMNIF